MLSGKSREFFAGRWYQYSMWMQIEFLSKICFCAHLQLCSKKAILENELSEMKVVTSHLVHFLFKWDIFRGWGRQSQGGRAGSHHRITLPNLVSHGDTGGHLHLCCFQLLTTMNIAVMNNNIYLYLNKSFYFSWVNTQDWDCWIVVCLIFVVQSPSHVRLFVTP